MLKPRMDGKDGFDCVPGCGYVPWIPEANPDDAAAR
jgi:hypothetical protein